MRKILVFGEDTRHITETLRNGMNYEVMDAISLDSSLNYLSNHFVNLIIYQCQSFAESQLEVIRKFRSAGYVFPTLILADELRHDQFHQLRETQKLHLLYQPFEPRDLLGISQKLLYSRRIPQQVHKRYATNLPAEVETLSGGQSLPGSMFNLSMGGAYCEFKRDPNISVGDVIRFKVDLTDVARDHILNGKVVWTTRQGHFSGGPGLGFRFMKTGEIYKYLMEQV